MSGAGIVLLAVNYVRVSTEEMRKKGFSIPEQLERCRLKAQQLAKGAETERGQPVTLQIREFVDDFGGDIAERPVLEEVREFVRINRPAWFVCMDPDRFSRSLKLQLIVADDIETAGTQIVFVQMDYDPDDMMSRAFFQFRGLMSELDKAKILERTSRGKRGKVKAGRRPNGACPYGYRHNKELDQLEIYEPEAQWVRSAFDWVIQEHLNVYQVTQRLNDLGAPRKRSGGRWYGSVVRDLLANTSYYGEMRCNRKDFRGLAGISRLPRNKRKALSAGIRPQEEWIMVPVPSIIPRETWEAARATLGPTSKRGSRQNTGMLSMLVRCGVCGGPMTYARHAQGRRYFRCNRRYPKFYYHPGTPTCTNPHHRVEKVEGEVLDRITEWLIDPEYLERYLAANDNSTHLADELRRLRAEEELLAHQAAEKTKLQTACIEKEVAGLITLATANSMLAQIKQQLDEIEARATAVRDQIRSIEDRLGAAARVVAHFRSVAEQVPAEAANIRYWVSLLNEEQRRHLVRLTVESVVVKADGTAIVIPRDR